MRCKMAEAEILAPLGLTMKAFHQHPDLVTILTDSLRSYRLEAQTIIAGVEQNLIGAQIYTVEDSVKIALRNLQTPRYPGRAIEDRAGALAFLKG
jgi:hypothetical protein